VQRQHFDGEEVCARDRVPVSPQKGLPRHPLAPFGSGAGAMPASARMRLTVLRPSSWPRFFIAPTMRV
jgi:hypothetical protein